MFNVFPRLVGNPGAKRVIWSLSDMKNYVKANNHFTSVYTSVYGFGTKDNRINVDCPIIDKLYFDFDDDGYKCAYKFYKYCEKHDYVNYIQMSGRGYNCFLFVEQTFLKDKKSAIGNAVEALCKDIGAKCDRKVIGDVVRVCRIPRTFNFGEHDGVKTNRWCIPVDGAQLEIGDEYIKCLAESDKNKKATGISGKKLFDLTPYDTGTASYSNYQIEGVGMSSEETQKDLLGNSPKCIVKLLNSPNIGYELRRVLITWIRDNAVSEEECVGVLKKTLSPAKWKHCVFEEKQVRDIYKKQETLWFPRCDSLQRIGLCNMSRLNECGKRIY